MCTPDFLYVFLAVLYTSLAWMFITPAVGETVLLQIHIYYCFTQMASLGNSRNYLEKSELETYRDFERS